jgi:hypothetical protein
MSPQDYVNEYHAFNVNHSDLTVSSAISRYISGSNTTQRAEFEAIMSRLITKFKIGGVHAYNAPRTFYISGVDGFSSGEPFFRLGLCRAFDGRGTPEEFTDALRLAVLTGRCKREDAASYARKWFGIDCNTLVGNWVGLSSGTAIFAYVLGYGTGKLAGGTDADEATRHLLPLPPAETISSIDQGSVLVTYAPKATGMKRWEHIALIQSFSGQETTAGATGSATATIVEWGQAGGAEAHINSGTFNLVRGAFVPEKPGMKFWAIKSGDKYRLILNLTSVLDNGYRRKYGAGNDQEL